jgi:hypothetical protein
MFREVIAVCCENLARKQKYVMSKMHSWHHWAGKSVNHPLYSSDLITSYFHLFGPMKMHLGQISNW